MTATSRANRQMSLIRTCLVLLITLPALVLQSGSSARADHERQPACPRLANGGEITTTRTGEVSPNEWRWYSWKVLPGDHQVWLQGADDFELVLCINGKATGCSRNYGPVGEGCLATDLSGHPGFGREVKGPANILLGLSLCRGNHDTTCIPVQAGSNPRLYTLAVR